MPTLKKESLERYLRGRFGPTATLLTYGVIGKESSKGTYKQYGYGTPVKLTFRVGGSPVGGAGNDETGAVRP